MQQKGPRGGGGPRTRERFQNSQGVQRSYKVWSGIGEYVCTRKNRKRDRVEDGGSEEEEEEEARVVVVVVVVVVIGDIAVWPGQLRMR